MTKKNSERICFIREKRSYGTPNYFYGGASYGSELSKAKFFSENEIPKWMKEDTETEVISTDSKEGFSLLVEEIKRLQNYVDIEKPKVESAEGRLEMLYGFGGIQEFVSEYNKKNHPLIGISPETENSIIEKIVNKK